MNVSYAYFHEKKQSELFHCMTCNTNFVRLSHNRIWACSSSLMQLPYDHLVAYPITHSQQKRSVNLEARTSFQTYTLYLLLTLFWGKGVYDYVWWYACLLGMVGNADVTASKTIAPSWTFWWHNSWSIYNSSTMPANLIVSWW